MAEVRPNGAKWRIWLAIALSISLGNMAGQMAQAETVQKIDLNQAIQMALNHDYEVRMGKNDLEKANLVIREKVIGRLPQATIGAEAGKDLVRDKDIKNTTLTVQQTIPAKFQLYGEKTASEEEIATWEQQNTDATYKILRAEVVYKTISLYLNALKAQRWVSYYETAVDTEETAAEQARRQLDLGKITKVTQLTAENDLAKARYNLESKRQDYQVALKQLAQQIGVTDYRSLQLDPDVAPLTMDVQDHQKLHDQAIAKRLEMRQKQIAIQNAEQSLADALNQRLPALTLGYINRSKKENYSLEYDFLNAEFNWSAALQQSYDNSNGSSSISDTFGSNRERIQLGLSWTLDFGSAKNKAQQAAYELENAKLDQLLKAQDIVAEVDSAISQYELAVANVTLSEQAIPLYQKEVELEQLKFKMAAATAVDVAEAELNLKNAQVTLENAQYDLRLAVENLRLKLGELYK